MFMTHSMWEIFPQSPVGFSNGVNPCFLFYIRFKDCLSREFYSELLCRDQHDDFMECKFAKRQVYFNLLFSIEKFLSMA